MYTQVLILWGIEGYLKNSEPLKRKMLSKGCPDCMWGGQTGPSGTGDSGRELADSALRVHSNITVTFYFII